MRTPRHNRGQLFPSMRGVAAEAVLAGPCAVQSTTGSLVEGLPGDGGASDHIHLHGRGLFRVHPFGLPSSRGSRNTRSSREREINGGDGGRGRKRRHRHRKRRRERARTRWLFIRGFSLRSIRVHGPARIRRRAVTPALSDRPHCFNLPPERRCAFSPVPRPYSFSLPSPSSSPPLAPASAICGWYWSRSTCRGLSPSCRRPRRSHRRRARVPLSVRYDQAAVVSAREHQWQARMPVCCPPRRLITSPSGN